MTANGWLRILLVLGAVVAAAIPLGAYLARVLRGERIPLLSAILGPIERGLYRLMGVDAQSDQSWMAYAASKIGFSAVSMLLLYVQLRIQDWLPLNPTKAPAMSPALAFNTAVSFTTNTNWQAYSGETQASHLTQLLGLTFHNFTSAAAGIAVAAALIRGLTRRPALTGIGHAGSGLGNFWVDLTRVTLYLLLPLSLGLALIFCALGMPQTLAGAVEAHTLEGAKQLLALGPIASQEAIKLLGTNGGGFFNANSAHPFENPTPLSNALEVFAILVIAAAMTEVFGRFAKDRRQGRVLLAAMLILFVGGLALTYAAESTAPPALASAAGSFGNSLGNGLGNMEGKEVRFGIPDSALFAVATSATSCGAVDAAMDSLTPLGGLVPLLNIQLGEVIFGGVGSGLYGMLIFALLAVFIAGLMVGRTPEYLGKKIEAKEMKMAILVVLLLATDILVGTATAVSIPSAAKAALNGGPHGFTEILYGFSSATGNNGSAFAGLSADTPFYDWGLGIAMFVGRFLALIPVLAIAGSMANKPITPPSAGTFPTGSALFVGLLVGVILIVGALTFIPSLALGPIAEALLQSAGRSFWMRTGIFNRAIVGAALRDSLRKLDPRVQAKNPVMFVVEVVSVLTTALIFAPGAERAFTIQIAVWLWFTVLFANFAEAVAEGRGKAQADSLRRTKTDTLANRLHAKPTDAKSWDRAAFEAVAASALQRGDVVVVAAGQVIPSDGEAIEGIASVDESAITGESAPVIREAGGDRSAVTGGTRVLSDWLVIRISSERGKSFLDRMIALVEGAERQKTPNEIALAILLAGLTIIFLLATATLLPFGRYAGAAPSVPILTALLVCLIPTTIGGLLSAIGIAGMDRLVQHNVLAMSGRAVEAAGDVSTLLLDKTGTITLGNRMAVDLIPAPGVALGELAEAARLASLADETPEGRSIVVLCHEKFGLPLAGGRSEPGLVFIPFTAQTRMSGVDVPGAEESGTRLIRKGAGDAVARFLADHGGSVPAALTAEIERIAKGGGTPLVVADSHRALGVIHLKDVVKGGIRERFERLRAMGIKTVMITGDNPLTARAIATEAGVDDFLAEATPENKLELIRKEQGYGKLVAMTGDGTNDAPALAQADVGVAMNSGTMAAKEAGNMVDLDSNPTKLIEIVEIGKQLLMTRGALTTFSIANDVAKYFAILPALFVATFPELQRLNVMHLASPHSAILSAVIFNALIIVALIPLALRGVAYRPIGAAAILRRNLLVYGVGGIFVPFVGIKAIDLILAALGDV